MAKVGHAAALLLGGHKIDSAAVSAGFKASGTGRGAVRACDLLAKAVRRLGFGFQFNLPQSVKADALVTFERVAVAGGWAVLQPVQRGGGQTVSAIVRGWSFHPSAGVPAQRGKLSGAVVKRDVRRLRGQRHQVERKGKAARFAAVQSVKVQSMRRAQRLAVRGLKERGQWFGVFVPMVDNGAAIMRARLHASAKAMRVWGAVGTV